MKRTSTKETTLLNNLSKALLTLKTQEEFSAFLRDLCTLSELSAMNERLESAKRISAKESYRQIAKETGASTATITRVAHWLHHGMGGYGTVLARMTKNSTGVHET